MSEYQRFRTGFRGFSKDDVLTYIDSMRAEFREEREQYEGEIASLRRQLEESASKLAYLEEAEALSDRIAIMKNGKLLICDTAEKIKEIGNAKSFEEAFVNIVKGADK